MAQPEAPNPEEQPTNPRFMERDGHLLVPNPALYDRLGKAAAALFWPTGGLTISGENNLPTPNHGGVVAGTHDSMIGVVALCEAVRRQKIEMFNMAKNDFWYYPVVGGPVGRFFESCGAFPVNRKIDFFKQPVVVSHLESIIEHHGVVSMFPQGTRKNHERGHVSRRSLKPGVAFIALKYGLPITPGSGTDTYTFNHVDFRPQIPVEKVDFDYDLNFSIRKNKEVLRDFSRAHIHPLLDELYNGLDEAQLAAHNNRNAAIDEARLPKLLKRRLRIERTQIAEAA